jgi:hypothetical protein
VLIGAGVLLLLSNLNLLPPGMWDAIWSLWPVLLVLVGLEMIIGRRSRAGAALMLVIGALVIAGALTWAALRAQQPTENVTQLITQPMDDLQSASITVDFKVGELRLSALEDSAALMEGRITRGPNENVAQSYRADDNIGKLALSQQYGALMAPFLRARTEASHWEIGLSARLPLELNVTTGVGAADLDLSGLNVTALNVETGVGQTTVTLPEAGPLAAHVESGLGDVILVLPLDTPTRIALNSRLGGLEIPSRFACENNICTTAGFSTEGPYLDIELDGGVGTIKLRDESR